MNRRMKRCPTCGAQMPPEAEICTRCGSAMEDNNWVDELPRPVRPVETSRWPEEPGYEETAAQRKTVNRGIGQLVAVLAVIVAIVVVAIVLVIKLNAPQGDPVQESQAMNNNGVYVMEPGGTILDEPDNGTDAASQEPEESPEPTGMPQADEETPDEPEESAAPEEEEKEDAEEEEFTVSEMNDTVYISAGSVNLRVGPGTEYDVASTQAKGTELKRTGAVENGWSRVEYGGKVCYVSNDYISSEKPTVDVSGKSDTVVITSDANIRTGPGTSYEVVTTLTKGTELKRTGEAENGWSRVEYDGKEAYISDTLIKAKDSATATQDFTVTEESGKVKVTVDIGANIRTGPGSDYELLGAAPKDAELTVTGKTENNWYQVKFNDKTGYVAGSLVTKS